MARSHGRNASVYIDTSTAATGLAVPVSFIMDWSLDQQTDTPEVTSFGDTTKTYVGGLPDAQGTFNGFVNLGTTQFTTLSDGVARKFYTYINTSAAATTYFYGTGIFSSNYQGAVGDAIKCSISWKAASSIAWNSGI